MDKPDYSEITGILKTRGKPLVLIGMMGTGKSTLGRALAGNLNLDFVDSDKVIEEKADLTIAEIFDQYGEEKFRSAESRTILELLGQGTKVIATGGGAVMNPSTLDAIKKSAVSIWLQGDVDVLFDRVSKNKDRPLLQTDDPKKTLSDLLKQRQPYYEQADLSFTMDKNSIDAAAQDLIQRLYEFLTGNIKQ